MPDEPSADAPQSEAPQSEFPAPEGAGEDLAPGPETSRRGFLGLAGTLTAATVGLVSVPVLTMLAAPVLVESGQEQWVALGPVEGFGEEPREVTYAVTRRDGWHVSTVLRRALVMGREGEDWLVLSPICTHLGCGVIWRPEQKLFYCPCHGAEFNADGSVHTPPARRPLDRLEARVREGRLEVKET